MHKLRVLSLGAGVQSSTLALMIHKGEIPMVDCAIFADTQAEPPKVYEWLKFIKETVNYPVHIVTWRNLEQDLIDASEGKYLDYTIPFFYKNLKNNDKGMMKRQCTSNYKIRPIEKKIRQLLGYKKGERVNLNLVKVEQLLGISTDEMRRVRMNKLRYIENQYPLINDFGMSRQDCIMWMKNNNYPTPTRSACYFCPFNKTSAWLHMKKNDPQSFAKAIEIDKTIRNTDTYKKNVPKEYENKYFLHSSCEPLEKITEIAEKQEDMFDGFDSICDEGMCGV